MRNGKVQSKCETDYIRENVVELSCLVSRFISKNGFGIFVDDPSSPFVPNAVDVRVRCILSDDVNYNDVFNLFNSESKVLDSPCACEIQSIIHIICVPDFLYRSANSDYVTAEYYVPIYKNSAVLDDIPIIHQFIRYEIGGYPDYSIVYVDKYDLCRQIAELYWSICDYICESMHFVFGDGKVWLFDNYNE